MKTYIKANSQGTYIVEWVSRYDDDVIQTEYFTEAELIDFLQCQLEAEEQAVPGININIVSGLIQLANYQYSDDFEWYKMKITDPSGKVLFRQGFR